MGEKSKEQVSKPEIVDNAINTDHKETTIEDALQEKLPDSLEKQEFFLAIFKQQEIQSSFSSKEIVEYIRDSLKIKEIRALKSQTHQEQTKIIWEDMDGQIRREN